MYHGTVIRRCQYRLRTLFLIIGLAAIGLRIGLYWVPAQLRWVQARHDFLHKSGFFLHGHWPEPIRGEFPWSLLLFGEQPEYLLMIRDSEIDEAKQLFPEADIYTTSGRRLRTEGTE